MAKQFRPPKGVEIANILLLGTIGVGKSSFVNTLDAGFTRRVSQKALAEQREESVTTQVRWLTFILKHRCVRSCVRACFFMCVLTCVRVCLFVCKIVCLLVI